MCENDKWTSYKAIFRLVPYVFSGPWPVHCPSDPSGCLRNRNGGWKQCKRRCPGVTCTCTVLVLLPPGVQSRLYIHFFCSLSSNFCRWNMNWHMPSFMLLPPQIPPRPAAKGGDISAIHFGVCSRGNTEWLNGNSLARASPTVVQWSQKLENMKCKFCFTSTSSKSWP